MRSLLPFDGLWCSSAYDLNQSVLTYKKGRAKIARPCSLIHGFVNLLRQRRFEFCQFLRGDRLSVQVAVNDAVAAAIQLPSQQHLIGIIRANCLAVVGGIFLLLDRKSVV